MNLFFVKVQFVKVHTTEMSFLLFVLLVLVLVLMRRGRSTGVQREWLITAGATVSQRMISIRVYTSATLSPLIRTSAESSRQREPISLPPPLPKPGWRDTTEEALPPSRVVGLEGVDGQLLWPKAEGGTGSEDQSRKKLVPKSCGSQPCVTSQREPQPPEQRWSRPLDAAWFSLSLPNMYGRR